MDAASLSRRLKAARELAGGITVNQLADLVNKPRFGSTVIGSIERGERQAADHELDWLAEALSVPVAFLTDDEPFVGQGGAVEERLARLAGQLASDRQDREENIAEVKDLLRTQNENLQRQTEILEQLRAAVEALSETAVMQQASARRLEQMTEEAVKALPAPPARRAARKAPTGRSKDS